MCILTKIIRNVISSAIYFETQNGLAEEEVAVCEPQKILFNQLKKKQQQLVKCIHLISV